MSNKAAEKRAVSRKDMTKWQWTWKEILKNKTAYFMLAPFFILFLIFTVLPVFLSIILSLTDFNMLQMPGWKGLDNYIRLFLDDEIFMLAVQNTLIFACITGPVSYLLSLLIAWFINELPPKIRAVVTLIFYAPSISGQVYLIWGTLFAADSYGWVNATLMDFGIIDAPIARKPLPSLLREVRGDGKPCITEFQVLERLDGYTKLALRPVTGRTHQLRLHCAHMGFPILGDPQYGSEASQALSEELGYTSQLLCAKSLCFPHPITGEQMVLTSKLDV